MLKSDEEYVLQAQKGNDVACEYILNKYKSIVRSASRTYFLLGGDSDDIVQEGMIGLYKAICNYSAGEGVDFSAYAIICIKRQIYTAIKTAARKKHQPLNDYVSLDNREELSDDNPVSIIENREWRENLYKEIEENIKNIMGSKVKIKRKNNDKGKIEIEYYNQDDLERIYDMIKKIKKI